MEQGVDLEEVQQEEEKVPKQKRRPLGVRPKEQAVGSVIGDGLGEKNDD